MGLLPTGAGLGALMGYGALSDGVFGAINGFASSYFINKNGIGEALYHGMYEAAFDAAFGAALPLGGFLLKKGVLTAGSYLISIPAVRMAAIEYLLAANMLVREYSLTLSQTAKQMPVIRYIFSPSQLSKAARGEFGEFAGNMMMSENNFVHLGDGLFDKIHGIDSIFFNPSSNRMVFHDSKYAASWTATGNVKTLLGKGYGYQQMSDEWLEAVAQKLVEKSPEFGNNVLSTVWSGSFEKTISVVNSNGEMFFYRGNGDVWTLVK